MVISILSRWGHKSKIINGRSRLKKFEVRKKLISKFYRPSETLMESDNYSEYTSCCTSFSIYITECSGTPVDKHVFSWQEIEQDLPSDILPHLTIICSFISAAVIGAIIVPRGKFCRCLCRWKKTQYHWLRKNLRSSKEILLHFSILQWCHRCLSCTTVPT